MTAPCGGATTAASRGHGRDSVVATWRSGDHEVETLQQPTSFSSFSSITSFRSIFFQLCVRVFDGIVHVPLCPVQAALGFSELIATNV